MCACVQLLLFTGWCLLTFTGRAIGVCPLPPHPTHGRHKPFGADCGGADKPPACDGTPGTLAPENWLLTVHCDLGYQHPDPVSADAPSVCTNGLWSIPQLPSCIVPDYIVNDRERCVVPKAPPNSQIRLLAEECGGTDLRPGSSVPRDCILFINCAQGYSQRAGSTDLFICTNKTWNPDIPNDYCTRTGANIKPTTQTPQAPPQESPTYLSPTGCVLPTSSSSRKFCSFAAGCNDCDYYNKEECHLTPGSTADKVKVVCAPDYTIQGAQTNNVVVCTSNGWYPPMHKCLKLCSALKSDSLQLTCYYGKDQVPCNKPALPGTTVSFQCLPGFSEYQDFKQQGYYLKRIYCKQFGEWSDTLLPSCKPGCGVSKEVKRFTATVTGGKDAFIGFFPWHAGLYYREDEDGRIRWDQKCGGSLITERVVLTAAHCVYSVRQNSDLRVALGKYHRSWDEQEPTEQKRNVSDIIRPDQYNPNTYAYDIALLLLSEKIKFGEYIMPVCRDYAEGTTKLQNAKTYVVGWGKTSTGGTSSEILLYNTVTRLSESSCKKELPFYYSVDEKFCAYKSNSESITQKGDSGGGLTAVYEDGLHYIVGIVSSRVDSISLFTNIKWIIHRQWIDNQIANFNNKYDR